MSDRRFGRPLPLRCFLLLLACPAALLVSTATLSLAESPGAWSEFHGRLGRGVVEGKIPTTWTDSDYLWRRDLGSRDVGSPVVHSGRVYYLVSKPGSQQISIESVRLRDGKPRWSKTFKQQNHHLHQRNTFASSTPAVDDQNVFVAWSEPQHTYLKCFDHEGNLAWSRDFGTWQSQHGFGTSPRIFGSMILLFNSQQADQLRRGQVAGQSRMIAVDRKTGNTVWETPLDTTRSCYGVPAIHTTAGGRTQIIDANTGNGMFGLDAETGKMLWNLNVFEMRCCSTPVIHGDIAIASSGSGGGGNHLVGVRIPAGPNEKPEQVYRIDRGAPYVPTPVLKDGKLFMIGDKGIATCLDAESGQTIWAERIGGNFGASPIAIGDTILLISLDGKATLIRASERFEVLGEIDLGGPVGASPAYAEGSLLLRVGEELRCLGPSRS